MKKFLLITNVAVLISVTNLFAQDRAFQAPPGFNFVYTPETTLPSGLDGSPYLNDWEHAQLYLKNGNIISDLVVRYNVYSEQMMYKQDNETFIIGAPDSISKIKFPNKVFFYETYTLKDEEVVKGFFELVVTGKVNLINKYKAKVIPSNYNVALDLGNKNDRLTLAEQFYLQKEDEIIAINNKKKLLDVFSDKKKEVSEYIKEKKLSTKDRDDIIELVKYYNQLL